MSYTIGLAAHDISCRRGGRLLFEALSFALAPGEGLRVTGPNGSGKTSLLRLVVALLPLASGRFSLSGAAPETILPELCHYVGHANAVKPSFTVRENLAFWADYLGGDGADLSPSLAAFGLADLDALPAGLLSAGQKRRLALSRLAAAARPIWLLDEPQNSLDAASVERLDAAIDGHLAQGGIAIVASHVPSKIKFAHALTLGGARAA